jgi:hypothetical protein
MWQTRLFQFGGFKEMAATTRAIKDVVNCQKGEQLTIHYHGLAFISIYNAFAIRLVDNCPLCDSSRLP